MITSSHSPIDVKKITHHPAEGEEAKSFADIIVKVNADKMSAFLRSVPVEDGGLFARCLAIGIENGFERLDDDAFMVKRARITSKKWKAKRDWIRMAIGDTYNNIWFIPVSGRV